MIFCSRVVHSMSLKEISRLAVVEHLSGSPVMKLAQQCLCARPRWAGGCEHVRCMFYLFITP